MIEALCIAGLIGVIGAVLAIVVLSFMGKNATFPLILFVLSVLIILGSGFLPQASVGGAEPDQSPAADSAQPEPVDSEGQGPVDSDGQEPAGAPETEPIVVPVSAPDASVPDVQGMQPSGGGASGDLGACHVEVRGARLVKDYNGGPAVVVTYTWTNNSDKTTSAMLQLTEKAFQDGVELSAAFIGNSEVYDAEQAFKELRPGASLDVQCAFALTSEASAIEFEVAELFSTSEDAVRSSFDPAQLG